LTDIDIAYTAQCVPPDSLQNEEFSTPRHVKTRNPCRLHHPGKHGPRYSGPLTPPITQYFGWHGQTYSLARGLPPALTGRPVAFPAPAPDDSATTLKTFLRKFWSILALLAGAALIYFEWKRAGGITADNIFWLVIAALILILAAINLIQKPMPHRREESDINPPLH
jgi:hypothetical protein